jgi:hypothetical protein
MDKSADFEVISTSDENMKEENAEESKPYSQDDRSFLLDLYKENRKLLAEITDKEKIIARLRERNGYLVNSNLFWMFCYLGCMVTTVLTLSNS